VPPEGRKPYIHIVTDTTTTTFRAIRHRGVERLRAGDPSHVLFTTPELPPALRGPLELNPHPRQLLHGRRRRFRQPELRGGERGEEVVAGGWSGRGTGGGGLGGRAAALALAALARGGEAGLLLLLLHHLVIACFVCLANRVRGSRRGSYWRARAWLGGWSHPGAPLPRLEPGEIIFREEGC